MEGRYYRRGPRGFSLKRSLKNRWVIIGVFVGLPVLLYVLLGSHGLLQRFRLEGDKAELEDRILTAERENDELRAELKALESDPGMIEKVARERYGMARDGETVYRIAKQDDLSVPPADKDGVQSEGADGKKIEAPDAGPDSK